MSRFVRFMTCNLPNIVLCIERCLPCAKASKLDDALGMGALAVALRIWRACSTKLLGPLFLHEITHFELTFTRYRSGWPLTV